MDKVLNKDQIQAIEHGDGPLLIIAGAGTGKTTVITERIRYLITKKDIKPEEILALTFTEKAAHEMQERIDKIMPYGYTQMFISTFHSFCDVLLRQEAINFGLAPNYKLMTEAEGVLFLRRHIFKFELDYFRPLGNPSKFLEALLTHFARLSDEDITPEEYLSFARSQTIELDQKETTDERKEEIRKTLELSEAFKTYEELKIKEGVLDFSNLISLTLKLLRTRKHILTNYQKQFKHILVDEFQDTNYAQNELAIMFAGNNKNITAVCDDDQAIFKWRGAALSNVLQFKNNFPGSKMLTLTKNYRSTQEILDRSYKLIQFNNPNRLEAMEHVDKKLTSERKVKGTKIQLIKTQRVDEEAEEIAKEVMRLTKDNKYQYGDIAILVRANNHAQPITQALQRTRIPYQFLGPAQLFHQEEIKDLIAYLKVLYNLEDSVSLYRVLSMNIFNVSARDISYLLSSSRKRNLTLFETLEKVDETYISPDTKEKVKKIAAMILKHLERVKKDTAGQILFYFLTDTNLFQQFLDYKTQKEEQAAQNIARFFDKVKTFETLNSDANIFAVVDWIELMMEMGDSPLVADLDWKQANAVNILTIHSSKGLEFPVVFMINLVSDRFPTRERKEKIPLPANLIKEILPVGDYHLQEERRLFYVGMTRARDLLYFTHARYYAEGKREKKVSPFIYEALPEELKKEQDQSKKPTQLSLIELTHDYVADPSVIIAEKLPAPLKVTYLSFSSLQAFDICPLHYRARFLLNIPTPATAPLSFGISMHNVLKDFYEAYMQNKIPTLADLQTLLRKHWLSEGYQEKTYEKKMFEKGEGILKNYYENHFDTTRKPLAIEMPFSFYLDDIRIGGKIDRIDPLDGKGIEIIDYKTGSVDAVFKASYELQVGLYALAATRVKNEILANRTHNLKVSLFYLDQCQKLTSDVTDENLQKIEKKIKDKVKEIESSDFKCSKSVLCHNCEYKMLCDIS